MSWKGKAIGFVLGLVLGRGRWPLVALGLILGHLYDMGVFSGSVRPKPERPPPPASPAS